MERGLTEDEESQLHICVITEIVILIEAGRKQRKACSIVRGVDWYDTCKREWRIGRQGGGTCSLKYVGLKRPHFEETFEQGLEAALE